MSALTPDLDLTLTPFFLALPISSLPLSLPLSFSPLSLTYFFTRHLIFFSVYSPAHTLTLIPIPSPSCPHPHTMSSPSCPHPHALSLMSGWEVFLLRWLWMSGAVQFTRWGWFGSFQGGCHRLVWKNTCPQMLFCCWYLHLSLLLLLYYSPPLFVCLIWLFLFLCLFIYLYLFILVCFFCFFFF